MGQVYGRMSLPAAVSVYSRGGWSSGDHLSGCPSKAKPGLRSHKSSATDVTSASVGRRRRLSEDREQSDPQAGMRLTRQAARQLAMQQAAQLAASIRRSARLAGARPGTRMNRSSNASSGAGAATLPTTLRRSARIAGFRYIGHRMAADFNSNTGRLVRSRVVDADQSTVGQRQVNAAVGSSSASLGIRRSARLLRA